ncbi:MAG: MurR/RpiR family transcriptional regulator [Pseudonocardiaceae bacterium]|nr:MurR/RpiR family transcriptional regulator [Pseudonocardiaceae bacterium]
MPERSDSARRPTPGYVALRDMLEEHRLSAAQRRIAQYLLDNLPESAFLSSIELADRVGVSQPTVTRLAATLGFDGFSGFNDELRRLLLEPDGAAHPREPVPQNEYQESLALDQRNLERLAGVLADPATLRTVCRELAGSRPLSIVGIRASAPVALYLGYYAATIHPDVRTHIHGGGQLLDALEQARDAGGSWVIGVVLPHLPREMLAALRFARNLGLRTFVLTESQPPAALNAVADEVLTAPVSTRLTFDSHAAPMAMAAAVLHMITEAQPERFQRRLEDFDRHVVEQRIFHGYSNS